MISQPQPAQTGLHEELPHIENKKTKKKEGPMPPKTFSCAERFFAPCSK